jgi:hypothetical protein
MAVFRDVLIQTVEATKQSPSMLQHLSQWIASSSAAGISFGLNVVGVFLAIAGFLLYFQQKKEYRLLFGILQEFGLKEQVHDATTRVQAKHNAAKSELESVKGEIQNAQKDLKERLPAEAKRVYLESTIPIVEQQIFDLATRLGIMRKDLSTVVGAQNAASPEVERILREEVRNYVEIRREMDNGQSNLTVLTGLAAATGSMPLFFGSFVVGPPLVLLGFLILLQSLRIYVLHQRYYRARQMSLSGRDDVV